MSDSRPGLQSALADLKAGSADPPGPDAEDARSRWFAWRAERIAASLCEFCEARAGQCAHAHSRTQGP